MFRSARWRSEKNKIKAVFKLQFHATQVPQADANTLVISVVPVDVGKPTARLEKGIVREGSCRWEHPVYETVKFVRDAKTGRVNERIYHFVLSTGLTKSGVVGEASIDFANYVDSTKASTVSLPLRNAKADVVLHVSIQRLQENGDQRDEDSEDTDVKSRNRILNTILSNGDADEGIKSNAIEDGPLSNATTHNTELNDNSGASSGSDITMSSSDSSSGFNTPRELGLRNNLLQHSTSLLSSQTHILAAHLPAANASEAICEEHQQSHWEWSADPDHGLSTDDLLNGSQTALITQRSRPDSDIEIEKLKAELVALARQVNLSDLELQTLRKQIVKESRKGQELSREITCLKEERDALKSECEKHEAFQKRMEEVRSKSKLQFEGGDPWAILTEMRQELTYEKDLNSNLRLQLQKTQESNAELMLAVKDLDEMLDQKTKEITDLSNKLKSSDNDMSRSESDDDEEQKALEELVKEHRDAEDTCLLEQKIMDLSSEVEIFRRDKDELEMQMEQLALDYEILKQENHDMSYKLQQSQLQEQLKMQYECSSSFANMNELEAKMESLENEIEKLSKEKYDSLATIDELENHIKNLEEEVEKQAQGFEADLEAISRTRVEQEQRAIIAEEALRKTKCRNANTAEKLQEEFKKLSMQMVSTFDANEKVAMNALAEARELCTQKSQLEELLQKANEELQSVKDGYEAKLCKLSDELNLKMDQIEQMFMDIDEKSMQLEQQKKNEEELRGQFAQEISRLKSELERFRIDNNLLTEQEEERENVRLELEQMKASLKHTEESVQKGNIEKNELANTISLVRKEAEKSLEEFNRMKCLMDEKETAMSDLKLEVETRTAQCNDLRSSLLEDEMEKEKLRKQVFQLKSDLKKKEDACINLEKKLKETNKHGAVSDGTKNSPRNKSMSVSYATKEIAGLKEKIKLLEAQIKLKEIALEASADSFLEKERELNNIIEELESRVTEVNQNSASFHENYTQKISNGSGGISYNDIGHEEPVRSTDENLYSMICKCKENGNAALSEKRNHANVSEEETKTSAFNNTEPDADQFSGELAFLKERNKQMENELKEMQERYSEISLRFAEVEGERQQLVMRVRNLKNNMKC